MAASPFRDPNLHLAVLDAAWEARLLPEFTKTQRAPDPDAVDVAVRNALLATALPAAALEAIDRIDWGGGKVIQHLIVEMWDGEDETFDIRDLTGIASCANLRELKLGSANLQDLTPLLDLAALKRVDIGMNYRDDERNRGVLAKLKARGVALETREDITARQAAGLHATSRKRDVEEGMLAFQEKRYAQAVSALAPHESSLDGSERMKLQFARKKAGGGA